MVVQVTPRRSLHRGAGALLGLWGILAVFQAADGFSSDLADSCPDEILACLSNGECSDCLGGLAENGVAPDESAECTELFADVCTIVIAAGCDLNNGVTEDLATCLAREQFGCDGFTTCEDFDTPTSAATGPPSTGAPTPAPSAAERGGLTEAPTASPTASPTAAGTGGGTAAGSSGGTPAATTPDGTPVDGAGNNSGASRTVATAAAGTAALAIACGVAAASFAV